MSTISIKSASVKPAHECNFIRLETPEGNEILAVQVRYSKDAFYPWEVIRGEEYLPATKKARGIYFNNLLKAKLEADKSEITLKRQLKNTPVVIESEEEAQPEEVAPVALSVDEVAKQVGISVGQVNLFASIFTALDFEQEDTEDGYMSEEDMKNILQIKANCGYFTNLKRNEVIGVTADGKGFWVSINEKGKKIAELLNLK